MECSYKRWINMKKPSQPPIYRSVTGKKNEIIVLNYIENMFKKYTRVLESDFYREFALLDTIPNILNPKYIIQKMLQKYVSNAVRVYREPDFSQTFIFTFTIEGHERKFSFSNCMKFNEDVSIICFLHYVSLFNSVPYLEYNFKCETVQILTKLMRNKYGINFNHELIPIESKFTMSTIAQCFPSITWDMIYNSCNDHIDLSIAFDDLSLLLPDFDLPEMIFIPQILVFLPKLKNPPIAILVAIDIQLHDIAMAATAPKYPLDLIYHQILETYNYSVVPERLKFELCMKWEIVIIRNNVYKFAPCFATHRLKAKHLILKLRPSDPKLKDILSKI